jgi:pantoate--beta-alanine ligase
MVKVLRTAAEIKAERSIETDQIGFVPTMGNLHEGHLSLLENALRENPVVYFSIFVNPKQFGPNEDFHKYPRTLDEDIEKIRRCNLAHPTKKVIVFAPKDPTEVFPSNHHQIISVLNLSSILEGMIRPGHFEGVATVVYRLFEIIKPSKCYLGLKDYQQYLIIRQMVKDLMLPIDTLGLPIIRDNTGLALSSRNQFLSMEDRKSALTLTKNLTFIASLINGKKQNIPEAKNEIKKILHDHRWNYLELCDSTTLSTNLEFSNQVTLLGVFQIGSTRLLDNIQMEIR